MKALKIHKIPLRVDGKLLKKAYLFKSSTKYFAYDLLQEASKTYKRTHKNLTIVGDELWMQTKTK